MSNDHVATPNLAARWKRALFGATLAAIAFQSTTALADGPYAQLDRVNTKAGYLARLLINENPFPGEHAYVSEANTQEAMLQVLWVLHSRIALIPAGYTQWQIAGVRSNDMIDVITGGGGRRQCEGFYQNASGQAVTAPRVEERLNYLLNIANSGGAPGRFARLLNYGQGLARAYMQDGIQGADQYAALRRVGNVRVTGHAYSWMTDINNYDPGGNFVVIPDANDGAMGGNRFFTLRKDPK